MFNISSGGFVIVSSNANTESVLGYSTDSNFDSKNVPENFKALLKNYEIEIKNTKPISRNVVTANPIIREAIEPLVKVHWNQGHPYNMLCPEENGKKCWVGCTPTAMAQIMGYYKWPDKGHNLRGEIFSYMWNYQELSIDLDNTYFDWANMLDSYGSNSNAQQELAIATLMKACGYTCVVNYDSSDHGSGAYTSSAFSSLKEYFYYKGSRKVRGDFASDEVAMIDYMYDALHNKKPIFCTIHGEPIGHAIVIDGCDEKCYFHINWGWGGSSDGYFKLGVKTQQGGYTFDYLEDIIIVEPDYDKLGDISDVVVSMNYLGIIQYTDGSVSFFSQFEFSGNLEKAHEVEVGLKFENKENSGIYLTLSDNVWDYNGNIDLDLIRGLNLKDGEYKVNGVYKKRSEAEWKIIEGINPFSPRFLCTMKVSNGNLSFGDPVEESIETNISVDENRVISIEYQARQEKIHIFNTYGLRVYSGNETKIKVDCAGIYTVVIGNEFKKTIVIK